MIQNSLMPFIASACGYLFAAWLQIIWSNRLRQRAEMEFDMETARWRAASTELREQQNQPHFEHQSDLE